MSKQVRRTGVLRHVKNLAGNRVISSLYAAKSKYVDPRSNIQRARGSLQNSLGAIEQGGFVRRSNNISCQARSSRRAPAATDRYYLKHRHFLHVITRAITRPGWLGYVLGRRRGCRREGEGGIARSSDYHVMKDSPPSPTHSVRGSLLHLPPINNWFHSAEHSLVKRQWRRVGEGRSRGQGCDIQLPCQVEFVNA